MFITPRSQERWMYTRNWFIYFLMWFDYITWGKNTHGLPSYLRDTPGEWKKCNKRQKAHFNLLRTWRGQKL